LHDTGKHAKGKVISLQQGFQSFLDVKIYFLQIVTFWS